MARKFIASVLTAAIVITGFNAAPARAGGRELAQAIAGTAAVAIIVGALVAPGGGVDAAAWALVLGCGSLNPLGSKSKSTDGGNSKSPASGETSSTDSSDEPVIIEKTGVQKCDELMDFIAQQSQSKDDNYVSRAAREFFFNQIREGLRKSIEEQKGKPEELAKKCNDFKKQLETYKAREDAKKDDQ